MHLFQQGGRSSSEPAHLAGSRTRSEEAFCYLTSACIPESCWGPIPREKTEFLGMEH